MGLSIRAERNRPTGFSDPAYYKTEVTIIAFVHGVYVDKSGHRDSSSPETIAVFREGIKLGSAPISQFYLLDGGDHGPR